MSGHSEVVQPYGRDLGRQVTSISEQSTAALAFAAIDRWRKRCGARVRVRMLCSTSSRTWMARSCGGPLLQVRVEAGRLATGHGEGSGEVHRVPKRHVCETSIVAFQLSRIRRKSSTAFEQVFGTALSRLTATASIHRLPPAQRSSGRRCAVTRE
jgi:hypothetical protein